MQLKALIQKLNKVLETDPEAAQRPVVIRMTDGKMFYTGDVHLKDCKGYDPSRMVVVRTTRSPVKSEAEKRPAEGRGKE